jgi:hypothetical protein
MGAQWLSESAIRRAAKDTISAQKTARFMWGGEGVLAVAGGTWLATMAPAGVSTLQIVARSVIGGLGGLFIAMLIIFIWQFIRAPYKQRNEVRNMIRQLSMPPDSLVNGAIQQLQAEKLEMKHNNGEERSYSLAKVFVAIADQLSIGVSLNRFEEKIRKGLHIDDYEGWYFPYEADGITHLIGLLVQNTLVERHNEEDQHMTRELVSGATGIYLTPDAHLVKNTEVKYYLSSLGSRVVQQLRQQSTVHNEVAKTIQGLSFNEKKYLLEFKNKLVTGIRWYGASEPLLEQLCIKGIVELAKQREISGVHEYDQSLWVLTDLGKQIIVDLERHQLNSDK